MEHNPKAITEAAIRKAGSLHQLAEKMHVTVQNIDDWRTGNRIPQWDHLFLMRVISRGGLAPFRR